ncbi:LytR/AlgR family response regulator transcription factor [Senegalia massiliensis]|uniref:LytR/AlgR family response regulator transcription factor n=1 Tax=Senegalia massiliensis TaxID=1720316 RepID=UPI0010307EE7|nr:LytTR family DNA-binding domain-containing protein [Senegalia massiliensis]
MKLKVLVVDDELPAREEIKYLLEKYDDIDIIYEANNGIIAFDLIQKFEPDIIFLDINMPKISGIELADKIINTKNTKIPLIVFITAYDEYAIKAFELNAIDYLLKPIGENRLEKTLKKIRENLKLNDEKMQQNINTIVNQLQSKKQSDSIKLTLYKDGAFYPISTKDIIFSTVEDKNTVIITTKGKFIYHDSLSHLERNINKNNFFRSHRSFIINIDYIEKIEPWFNNTYNVKLKGYNEHIPVSRGQVKQFKTIMNII